MWSLLKSLSPPLLSFLILMMASGLFNTFISIRLELEHFSPAVIGIVTSALYAGILVGSLRIDRWIVKTGLIRSFIILGIILTILVILKAFWVNPWYWSSLRFIGGVCTAGIFIIIESWLLMQSAPNMRGGVLSIYLAVSYGALSTGQLFIDIADPYGFLPFFITASLVILSIIPVTFRKVSVPLMKDSVRLSLIQLFKISPFGFIGGVISGMLLAICFGLVPIYAKGLGMSLSEVGTFMAVLIFGGFSLQWPVGRWADRTDRRQVMVYISLIACFISLCIAVVGNVSFWMQLILAWFFGALSFTLYPLSMAYVCEKVKESQIVAATGGFVLSYGIGAISGPLLAPISMSFFGPGGLFYFLALIILILALVGLKRSNAATIE